MSIKKSLEFAIFNLNQIKKSYDIQSKKHKKICVNIIYLNALLSHLFMIMKNTDFPVDSLPAFNQLKSM